MRRNRWLSAAVLVATVVLGVPSTSYAVDPKKPPPPPATSAGDDSSPLKYLAEGNKAFKAGKLPEAEAAYEQAFARKKVYDIAGNLAMAEAAQGKMREAAEHLAFALRLFPMTGDPAQREAMQKAFDQMKANVGQIKVKVNVGAAEVLVDGTKVGETPLEDDVFVEPGEHTIEAKKEDYKPFSQKVKADKGSTQTVTLTLVAAPKPNKEVIVEVPVQVPQKKRSMIPAIAAGGGAVLFAIIGGGLLGASGGKESDALALSKAIGRGRCLGATPDTRCAELESTAYQVSSLGNAGVGMLVTAGILGVGAITYLLLPPPKATSPTTRSGRIQVAPVVGADQGGMIISGAF